MNKFAERCKKYFGGSILLRYSTFVVRRVRPFQFLSKKSAPIVQQQPKNKLLDRSQHFANGFYSHSTCMIATNSTDVQISEAENPRKMGLFQKFEGNLMLRNNLRTIYVYSEEPALKKCGSTECGILNPHFLVTAAYCIIKNVELLSHYQERFLQKLEPYSLLFSICRAQPDIISAFETFVVRTYHSPSFSLLLLYIRLYIFPPFFPFRSSQ